MHILENCRYKHTTYMYPELSLFIISTSEGKQGMLSVFGVVICPVKMATLLLFSPAASCSSSQDRNARGIAIVPSASHWKSTRATLFTILFTL